MDYDKLFGFLICSEMPKPLTLSSSRLQRIVDELVRLGYATTLSVTTTEARSAIRSDASFGCVIVEWSLKETESDVETFVKFVRERGLDFPIFILAERHLLKEIPVAVLGQVTGYVFIDEDTPEFIARNLVNHLKSYAESLKTPFFGAMVDYAEQANQMWTCPGHNGGVFYQKSPIGRAFVEHLGEAVFRNDIDNSVVELGDLLIHEGQALAAEKAATLALVYPPGIGVVVPGERYDERALPMLDYFRMIEEGGNLFPGFENEIQGIYRREESDGTVRLYTYVVNE
ncbi:MAG: Orn/Lys/Arg decarboxylase N-terminal domain-containing protein [Anaerolineales bacterium]